jgi:uncharacterized protein YidB (DUF937 family)
VVGRDSFWFVEEEIEMGLLDNIFGSDSGSAVPGGNITKPLMIALLALLASRYLGGGQKEAPASADPETAPTSPGSMPNLSPGGVLDGLGGLLKQFQKNGHGDTINTWINPGANKTISSGEVSEALGEDVVDELSRRTGLARDQVLTELARMLPKAVDKLTPQGRLPTQHEMARLIG